MIYRLPLTAYRLPLTAYRLRLWLGVSGEMLERRWVLPVNH